MKINLLIVAFAAIAAMSFRTDNHWELLGSRTVDYSLDKDEILVTRAEGVFTALQVKVKNGPINMHRLIVHFGNGEKEEIELRQNFMAGSESRVIDLPGNKRVIRKIQMLYDTKDLSDRKGVVEVWGKHDKH